MDLFKNTVQPETWDLLKGLMEIPELAEFALVGGTNLSLKLGHRISEDIDLFTNKAFDRNGVFESIVEKYPQTIKIDERKQTLLLNIDGVKVDIILHQYPYLKEVEKIEDIRFLALEDVVPMKLEAMATRGVKKDFWDLAELANHYTLEQMLGFHVEKYPNSDIGHIILAMTYFEDAEKQESNPQDLKGQSWNDIKKKIKETVKTFMEE